MRIALEDCVAFLRAKLADAEKGAKTREDMAKANEGPYDRKEWRAVMDAHPTTRGKPIPTKKSLREDAALQRRIRDRHFREAALYDAAIELLKDPAVERLAKLESAAAYVKRDLELRAVDGVVAIGAGAWAGLCDALAGTVPANDPGVQGNRGQSREPERGGDGG